MESLGPPEQKEENINYFTDEMKEYVPTERDLFITIRSGDYQRLIWGEPMELREREEVKWQEFMDYIKDN